MADRPLHVVFGAGNVGQALACACQDWASRSGWCRDANPRRCRGSRVASGGRSDPAATAEAASGAAVIYQCLNAPYTKWADAVPAAPAWRPGRSRAERGTVGQPGKPLRLRPDRWRTHDRGPPARGHDRQGPDPGRHDPRAARCTGRRPGSYRHRTGIGLLRSRRHRRFHARRAGLRQRHCRDGGPTSSAIQISSTPTATSQTSPAGWPPWAPTSGPPIRSGTYQARDCHHPAGPRAHRLRGRAPGRQPIGVQARPACPGSLQSGAAVHGRDDLPVRPALRARHPKYEATFREPAPHSARPSPPPSPGIGPASKRPARAPSSPPITPSRTRYEDDLNIQYTGVSREHRPRADPTRRYSSPRRPFISHRSCSASTDTSTKEIHQAMDVTSDRKTVQATNGNTP